MSSHLLDTEQMQLDELIASMHEANRESSFTVENRPDHSIKTSSSSESHSAATAFQNGSQNLNGHNGNHKADSSLSEARQVTYSLSEVADRTGLYPQYILTLIDRYHLISPVRSESSGSRKAYQFTTAEIDRIQLFQELTAKGIKTSKAVQMVAQDEEYRRVGNQTISAISSWLDHPDDSEEWASLIETISCTPGLDDRERKVFFCVQGMNKPLTECVAECGFRTEKEARDALASAYGKVGEAIFFLLRRGIQP